MYSIRFPEIKKSWFGLPATLPEKAIIISSGMK
jgi:hypothetical protein